MNASELKLVIEGYFKDDKYKKSFRVLSNGLVYDDQLAFDFDSIKDDYCKKEKISSADALLFKGKKVFLIEYKRGFEKGDDANDKLKATIKESERRSIRLKALESELLLEKIIMNNDAREFPLYYVAVIDSKEDPKGAIEEIILEKSQFDVESSSEKAILLKELTEKSLLMYRKEISGRHLFYDNVKVLYDYEFCSDNL